MHRELIRRVLQRRVRTEASERVRRLELAEGRAWCGRIVTEIASVLSQLGVSTTIRPAAADHPEVWEAAIRSHAKLGAGMGGPAHVDLLYHLCRELRPECVLETGVAAGWSSLALLLALEDNGRGRLISVDMPYPKRDNERFVGCVVPDELRGRWELVPKPDRDALPEILARIGPLDLAHYDSDKSYEGRMFAYTRLWRALRKGGVLVSDDVEDNAAFRDFASAEGRTPFVFRKHGENFAGLLRR